MLLSIRRANQMLRVFSNVSPTSVCVVYLHLLSYKAFPSFPHLRKVAIAELRRRATRKSNIWKNYVLEIPKKYHCKIMSSMKILCKYKSLVYMKQGHEMFSNTKGYFLCSRYLSCWVRSYFDAKSLCGFIRGLVAWMDEESINSYCRHKCSPWAESVWRVEKHC